MVYIPSYFYFDFARFSISINIFVICQTRMNSQIKRASPASVAETVQDHLTNSLTLTAIFIVHSNIHICFLIIEDVHREDIHLKAFGHLKAKWLFEGDE